MILVGIGGFLGAICRYLLGAFITSKWPGRFPLSTWLINSSGSFALGVLVSLELPSSLMLLLATGFLGAYTTFSTFGYESVKLIEDRLYWHAFSYVITSVIVGILFAGLGFIMIDSLNPFTTQKDGWTV